MRIFGGMPSRVFAPAGLGGEYSTVTPAISVLYTDGVETSTVSIGQESE